MSGIAVIYDLTGAPADPDVLQRMTDVVAHRGPDGAGYWREGPVGLGCRLFRTTPEAAQEAQPLADAELGLAVTADARIDNRAELLAEFRARGLKPAGETDVEILLCAYTLWGEACVEHVVGDFAFAVWDAPRKRMFLARDPLGIRPLLYWFDGRLLLLASEPEQIFEHPVPPREVNWALMGDYLCGNWSEPEETLHAGIRRLLAGHVAVLDRRGFRARRYWPVDLNREIRYPRTEDYGEHFLELLEESIRCRLRASTPVGVLLSGGLDSSSIACTAQKILRRDPEAGARFETISLLYPGLPCDESEFIDAVVRDLDVPAHRIVYGEEFHEAARLERAREFWRVGYAPAAVGQVLSYASCARKRGIRVLLNGFGGDELFVSTPSNMADALRAGNIPLLFRRLRHARGQSGTTMVRLFLQRALWPLLPEGAKQVVRRVPGVVAFATRAEQGVGPWVDADFASRHGIPDRWQRRRRSVGVPCRAVGRRRLYELLVGGYNMIIASEWTNRVASALGIENRHPFLDRRLVDFCLLIPEEERVAEGEGKFLLRRALRGVLPEVIRQRRSKPTFDCVWQDQLVVRQAESVEHVFRNLELEGAGVLKKGGARRLLAGVRSGDQTARGAVDTILHLELWYRDFRAERAPD